MFKKFLGLIRRIEKFFLRGILVISSFFAPKFRVVGKLFSNHKVRIIRNTVTAVLILYVIGGIAFGIRLYGQNRSEKIDIVASNIYPFPVASVGRTLLFGRELQYKTHWAKTFASKTQNDISADLSQKILDDMVSDAISMQQANRLGIRVFQKDIEERFDYVISGIGTKDQAVQYLDEYYGMTLSQLKKQAIPKIALEKIKDEKFVKFKISHILITDDKKAEEVSKKLSEGGNFADLAKEFSEDTTSKESGGILADGEYIYLDSGLITEIEQTLKDMKAGQVSPIIKSSMGNHIIKVDERLGEISAKVDDWILELEKDFPVRSWI